MPHGRTPPYHSSALTSFWAVIARLAHHYASLLRGGSDPDSQIAQVERDRLLSREFD